jgi:hypothetical protein
LLASNSPRPPGSRNEQGPQCKFAKGQSSMLGTRDTPGRSSGADGEAGGGEGGAGREGGVPSKLIGAGVGSTGSGSSGTSFGSKSLGSPILLRETVRSVGGVQLQPSRTSLSLIMQKNKRHGSPNAGARARTKPHVGILSDGPPCGDGLHVGPRPCHGGRRHRRVIRCVW